VRFRHADHVEGEVAADGKVIIHYDEKDGFFGEAWIKSY
jgi:hypothetical protein